MPCLSPGSGAPKSGAPSPVPHERNGIIRVTTAYILASLYLALIAITAANARAANPPKGPVVARTIVQTWQCQDKLPTPRTRARSPWKEHSDGYWNREKLIWTRKLAACRKTLHAHDATIRRLQRGLAGTPMDGSAGSLEAAGRRYGISPYFIAAIAGTESSFGAAACSGNPYNAFGLSSCTTGWHVPYFRSWSQAYLFMAKFLTDRWPRARTVYDYHGYAACSSCWGASTAGHMRERFGVGPEVRYGS